MTLPVPSEDKSAVSTSGWRIIRILLLSAAGVLTTGALFIFVALGDRDRALLRQRYFEKEPDPRIREEALRKTARESTREVFASQLKSLMEGVAAVIRDSEDEELRLLAYEVVARNAGDDVPLVITIPMFHRFEDSNTSDREREAIVGALLSLETWGWALGKYLTDGDPALQKAVLRALAKSKPLKEMDEERFEKIARGD